MPAEPNSTLPLLTVAGKSYKSVLRWNLRRDIRFYVFTILVFVAADWLYSRTPQSLNIFRFVAILVAAYVIWPFVQGSILLHQDGTRPLGTGYKFADAENALSLLSKFSILEVQRLGFRPVTYLEKESLHPLVKTFVGIFVQPDDGHMAQIAVVKTSLRTTHLVVFNTAFDDGLVLESSSNFSTPPLFPPKPRFVTFRFPRVRSVRDRYLLHRRLVEEHTKSRKPLKASADNVVARYLADTEEIHAANMSHGDYKLADTKDRYVYTWKGANRSAFMRTWPVDPIRRYRLEAKGERDAKRLGFRMDPKFRWLVPINESRSDALTSSRHAPPDSETNANHS